MMPITLRIPTPCLVVLSLLSGLQNDCPLFKKTKVMTDVLKTHPWTHPVRFADLAGKKVSRFELQPPADVLAAIADELGILNVKKLRFVGEFRPVGRRDWTLSADLGASVVQPCVVTLEPVSSRIDETITRTYVHEMPEYESGSETEMPDDDTVELLPDTLDLGDVMVEALALYLPEYPRLDGAAVDETLFTEPGVKPMTDEDTKPFAGLKSLRDALGKTEE